MTTGLTSEEHAVELSVADDGPGIPERVRKVVLSGEETPLEHLDGLGLWLVRWVVRNSAGNLDIREHDSAGTVVSIRLSTELPAIADGGEDDDSTDE